MGHRRQNGLTQARKREMLDRVLTASGSNPDKLVERMQGLLRAWARNSDDDLPDTDAPAAPSSPAGEATSRTENPAFATLLATLLDGLAAQAQASEPALSTEARELAAAVCQQPLALSAEILQLRLDKLSSALEWASEDQHALRDALQRVLQLILENISELVVDDRWLHGQIVLMGEIFAHPLDVRVLGELETACVTSSTARAPSRSNSPTHRHA